MMERKRKNKKNDSTADIAQGAAAAPPGNERAPAREGGKAKSELRITNDELPKAAGRAKGSEMPPHPAAGAATLSPGRGLDGHGVGTAGLSPRRGFKDSTNAEIAQGATSAPPGTKAARRHVRVVTDVADLPAELREAVDRMLVEGATFEDVCEAINDRGAPLTLQAIQNLYRGSLDLQRRRIEFQVERARVLTEAMGDPDSSDSQLAYAAMLTGLQSLTRKEAGITLKDAVKGTMERRNILLKRDLLRMRLAREEEDKRFRKTRLHAELLKLRLMRTKLAQLQRELKKQGSNEGLGRSAMEKIQEIYGLLQIPVIPRDVEPAYDEKKLRYE